MKTTVPHCSLYHDSHFLSTENRKNPAKIMEFSHLTVVVHKVNAMILCKGLILLIGLLRGRFFR